MIGESDRTSPMFKLMAARLVECDVVCTTSFVSSRRKSQPVQLRGNKVVNEHQGFERQPQTRTNYAGWRVLIRAERSVLYYMVRGTLPSS